MKAGNIFPIPLHLAWISSATAEWMSCWSPFAKIWFQKWHKGLWINCLSQYIFPAYCIMQIGILHNDNLNEHQHKFPATFSLKELQSTFSSLGRITSHCAKRCTNAHDQRETSADLRDSLLQGKESFLSGHGWELLWGKLQCLQISDTTRP